VIRNLLAGVLLGIFSDGFEEPAPIGCDSFLSDPLFQPQGFTEVTRTWRQLWGWSNDYPIGRTGEPYPIGSYTLNGNRYNPPTDLSGKYITVPFIATGGSYQFNWIQAKPVSAYGYQPARQTDQMYVTLTTCPGDFRLTGSFQFTSPDPVNDPTFIRQCRNAVISETSIYYGPEGFGRCPTIPGKQYYLNIIFANPFDGLDPNENGCRNQITGACETSWRHLVN
jgi:hypothetical protein